MNMPVYQESSADEQEELSTEVSGIIHSLSEDLKLCSEEADKTKSQFWRRAYARALFAYIEGLTYLKKLQAYYAHKTGKAEYTKAELAVILEETYELNSKGEATERTTFNNIDKNIRFAFQVYAQIYGLDFQLDCSDHRWDAFKKAVKIRNRVTHPKRLSDLTITDADMQTLDDALVWYAKNDIQLRLLESAALEEENKRLNQEQERLRRELQELESKT